MWLCHLLSLLKSFWKVMMTVSFIAHPAITIVSITFYLLPSLSTMRYEMLVMACQIVNRTHAIWITVMPIPQMIGKNMILKHALISFATLNKWLDWAKETEGLVTDWPHPVRCTIVQSTVLRSHVVCLSVCLSLVCNVGGSWPHRLKILETNCVNN